MKRNEDSLRDLWDNNEHSNIQVIGIPEEEEEDKVSEKIFKEITIGNIHFHEKGNSHSSLGSAESHIQDKPKEKHDKTHINQTNKNWMQK